MPKKEAKKGVIVQVPMSIGPNGVVKCDVDLSDEEVVSQGMGWVEIVDPSDKLLKNPKVKVQK